jgi:hypothetical protein
VSWRERRYSPWLLAREERLTRARESAGRLTALCGIVIAVAEALLPWSPSLTPDIPALAHIAAAALLLPVLYFMLQADYRRKLQAFTVAMSDLGRRLYFLDPFLDPEEFEIQTRLQGALLLPTQRALAEMLKTADPQTLSARVNYYFRMLPSPVYEEDRMGLLSILHPRTALTWAVAIAVVWLTLPEIGVKIGTSDGLSLLGLLLPLYLLASRLNSRFAYELALYNWLRLG